MGQDPLQVLGATIDGKYDLTEFVEVRRGRYIYRATHRFWKDPVAVALYAHDTAQTTVDQDTSLRGYIKIGAQLSRLASRNSAIVQARDAGMLRSAAGDLAYIVCEWVDAITLEQVLAKTRDVGSARLGLSAVLDWMFDIIRALTMAHEAGMVHGAICPANIFVIGGTFRPSVPLKLRGLTDAAWRASGIGVVDRPNLNDPRYAAPEVIADNYDPTLLGPWTDVYGLATVITELVTGAPPPAESAIGAAESFVSRQCLFALDRALAFRHEDRFKSVEMFRSALLEGMGVRGGRQPRRTMVVADQLKDVGSAGTFEIGGDAMASTPDPVAPEPDVPKPRVRLALTQRVDAAKANPTPAPRRTLAVPQAAVSGQVASRSTAPQVAAPPPGPSLSAHAGPAHHAPAAEYGSGVYDQLSQDRSRTIIIVLAILALGGMAAYLIVAMGAR